MGSITKQTNQLKWNPMVWMLVREDRIYSNYYESIQSTKTKCDFKE